AGEILTAEADREAEVVLDARAGPGLTPEATGVDDQDRETLRGAVHRRRQSRWTRAHHGDVVSALANRVRKHVQVAPESDGARILQHRPIGTDDEGKVLRPGGVPLDQCDGVRVRRGVEDGVRILTPEEELLEPVEPGMARRGNEDGTCQPERGERLA